MLLWHWSFHHLQPCLLLLVLLSFVSSVPSTNLTSAKMVPSELETIFTIMETMSSDHTWRLTYPDPCKAGSAWAGIECRQGSDSCFHVNRLEFGTRPNPSCKPTARFPSQIFELPFLESVFFIGCFTHTRTSISIIRVLCSASLLQFSLRSNPTLIGSIPVMISSLKALQVLTLSQNRLTGRIPLTVSNLVSLVHLDLSYNSFSGTIPHQIRNLQNLVVLDLSYNSLTGLIPSSIGQLRPLQKLDLSSNSLYGVIPSTIENLSSLAFLALCKNKLRGNFPQGLDKLQNLRHFLMDENPLFIPLPYLFGRLLKLQELSLANCGLSGTIPPSFSHLTNLSTLYLQNNLLTGDIPASFSNLSHLYHLNLSQNMLAGTVPFNSSFLRRLGKYLDLSGNPGLCLSSSDVENGVQVCGRNGTASTVKPLKSKASATTTRTRSFIHASAVWVLLLGLVHIQLLFLL